MSGSSLVELEVLAAVVHRDDHRRIGLVCTATDADAKAKSLKEEAQSANAARAFSSFAEYQQMEGSARGAEQAYDWLGSVLRVVLPSIFDPIAHDAASNFCARQTNTTLVSYLYSCLILPVHSQAARQPSRSLSVLLLARVLLLLLVLRGVASPLF